MTETKKVLTNREIIIMIIVFFALLMGIVGYHMAKVQQANDRLKRMEVAVAVCGDVAAYFAPDDELTAGVELSALNDPTRSMRVSTQSMGTRERRTR